MSQYMTESEARAVARWKVGSWLKMVREISRWVLSRCLKVCTVGALISYGGWDFIANLGGAQCNALGGVCVFWVLLFLLLSLCINGPHQKHVGVL